MRRDCPATGLQAQALRLPVGLALDPGVWHAEREQISQHGLEESRLRRLTLFLRGLMIPFRYPRATDVDDGTGEIRHQVTDQRRVHAAFSDERPTACHVR